MLDSIPDSLNKSGNQFFFKRNKGKPDLERLLNVKVCEKKYLVYIACNEQIEEHLQKRKKIDSKKNELEESRKRKLDNIYNVKNKRKSQNPGILCINS